MELKNIFIDYLSEDFIEDNEVVFAYENNFLSDVQSFSSTAALTFFVLLALGFKDKLIGAINEKISSGRPYLFTMSDNERLLRKVYRPTGFFIFVNEKLCKKPAVYGGFPGIPDRQSGAYWGILNL